jgi:hypothetical protein
MAHIRSAVLLSVVFLLFPVIAFAGTGILEVRSEPSGARISIDDADAGTTPYQNIEMPAGKHTVKAVLGPDYPPQVQEVLIDEKSPQVVIFRFLERSKGTFAGKDIILTTAKYKGNVTFASIPTGAIVVINGEPLRKPTPIGYTDVEVGRYSVEFVLEKRTLHADFEVVQGETIKLIADFAKGKVINKWEAAKQEAAKQEAAEQVLPAIQPTAILPPATKPQAAAAEAPPQPVEGYPPFGELAITVNVRRDADLKYSDYFDVSFPKLPIDSLSGPLFPAASSFGQSKGKDNFEYMNDANDNTRQFFARVHFGAQATAPAEQRAQSGVVTVREGKYDLKVTRRRIVEHFSSVEKLLDAMAREAIEIVRGNRLIVQISSHLDADNKLQYDIKRSYETLGKKKSEAKGAAAQNTSKAPAGDPDYRSLPLFTGSHD